MSTNTEEEKSEAGKSFPLDLASKLTAVKTIDAKTPIVTGQQLRGMRLLTHSSTGQGGIGAPTIITANMPQIIKQNTNQSQVSGTITVQRPAQITLATASIPVVAQTTGTTYHVPRGPAVVANLAAPRSNVSTARGPIVVAQTTQNFVRPPRTPSPALGSTWHPSNTANGAQIKATLSPPIKTTTAPGCLKSQIIGRAQTVPQNISTVRPTSTILQSAITVGQNNQVHTFNKTAQNISSIQTIGSTVTIAQVLPSRTQTLVYSSVPTTQFVSNSRVTIASSLQTQRQPTTPRPMAQVSATRLPVNVPPGGTARLVTPQILATSTRISTVSTSQQPTIIGTQRILSTAPSNVTVGRLPTSQPQTTTGNIITQNRIPTLSLQPIVAVATTAPMRALQPQVPKVITQQTQQGASIHLAQLPNTLKSAQTVTPTTRTINVQPAALVAQRQANIVPSQTIPLTKVFSQEGQAVPPTNVFIHAPVNSLPRRSSPSPSSTTHSSNVPTTTTTVAAYSIAGGTYFYDNYSRPFGQQQSSFAAITPVTTQQRATNLSLGANQSMRFNQVMVIGGQQFTQQDTTNQIPENNQQQHNTLTPTKLSSSSRPSILRKRDHEGSPLKSAKNLQTVLTSLAQQPSSPPSRPDSAGNGNSSAGSTTISATSSPGPGETNEDSLPPIPMNKEEEENRPPLEMSPRKKPRKQQLTGNDIMDEVSEEMQFLSENNIKKEEDSDGNRSEGHREYTPEVQNNNASLRKSTSASLLNSYRHPWKTTQNHFLRYSDVRPKEERKPSIVDLANQCKVMDKVNGWKVHHLTTQMLDLAEQGDSVYSQLEELLKSTDLKGDVDSDVDRVNELIKGNLQRIKVINEGMVEAKSTLMKIFDHKVHVTDIINRCASKRNFKKRDKS
ncbi:histone deacetylase complex subunit SAP130 [Onthophagus taurus]|uniref:histone deacetylase complex subunit SAP130 n=1 Tax=Onthophagus taurus TaxID=166361 RepID=UPI000C207D66|nr:histone deacetylase complex subunit SAP130 [Onthophagus taurus]